MRVAVASQGDNLDAQMDPRFGRCAYFVIVDTDTWEFEAFENAAGQQASGAGVAAAQMIGDSGVEAVVAGNYGPNSTQVLQAGGIRMLQAAGMTVRQAAEAAANGQLNEVAGATVADKAGLSGGNPGLGGGGGMGGGLAHGHA
ncbi:MAG: NifB/NifX family molybdenum-iron cluster-binding protein, partial [Armatimonadetes bacterium]|nr:NifB/NifX family molybdenum-iron cluster-binding protein [Armatimonadota bacterium]